MMKSILLVAALLALGAGSPAAAGGRPFARLVGVSGNVLVTTESNIASAGEALRLAPGMRILVTANSSATVEYKGGCRVRLQAGARLQIRGDESCPGGATTAAGDPMPAADVRR